MLSSEELLSLTEALNTLADSAETCALNGTVTENYALGFSNAITSYNLMVEALLSAKAANKYAGAYESPGGYL